MPLSARERSVLGKLAVETSWANTQDRTARTAKGRRALEDKFLTEAGGDPVRAKRVIVHVGRHGRTLTPGSDIAQRNVKAHNRCTYR